MSAHPLAGLKVLEFTHTVMGPTAGLLFAELGADVVMAVLDDVPDAPDATVEALETEVLPWKPMFDQTDDLDGLLEARGPLLARAFGGQGRQRPVS